MRHLTSVELVDALEGALIPERAAHLDACAACHEQLAGLRSALGEAGDVEAAEPSPLFWDHLSARVREAIAEESVPASPWWSGLSARPVLAAACALLVLVVAAGVWRDTLRTALGTPDVDPVGAERAGRMDDAQPAFGDADPEFDESWALVLSVAGEIDWEDEQVAGIGVRPGTAEGAVLRLTDAERMELARLLTAELNAMGS
jgi:hypothetical protein